MAFGKAYCFGPTFRAEKSKTRRHLAEFWMVEPEVAFMDLEGDMELAEDFLAYIVGRVLETRNEPSSKIARARHDEAREGARRRSRASRYDEAIEILQKNGHPEAKFGDDFGGDEETVISEQFDRPVIVHRYPTEMKAFYFKRDPNDPTARARRGRARARGLRRDHRRRPARGRSRDARGARSTQHKLPREAFEWYLDLRRYGSVPHAGFGLGIERTVAWICGLHHVRETIPFPRMMDRLTP